MMDNPSRPEEEPMVLDCQEVMQVLPHRHPFLLIDRVISLVRGKYIHGIKNVSISEPFFQELLPGQPVMPGVLIMEALAQTCGILVLASEGVKLKPDSVFYFVGIDKGRFRKPVLPGDQMLLKASLLKPMRGIWRFQTRAEVDGSEVASAQMMIAAGS